MYYFNDIPEKRLTLGNRVRKAVYMASEAIRYGVEITERSVRKLGKYVLSQFTEPKPEVKASTVSNALEKATAGIETIEIRSVSPHETDVIFQPPK